MKRVKSAKDLRSTILLWFGIIISVAVDFFTPQARLTAFLLKLPLVIFMIWVYFGSWYELREKYLYCQYGPLKEKIYYRKIKSVKLTENNASSSALSRKRISIKQYGNKHAKGTTMISPVDRDEFFAELKERCINLEENAEIMLRPQKVY